MTPEQEALREKVAREIYDILEGPVADQDFGRQTRQWKLSLVLADAAIAVVLKEAANEIRAYSENTYGVVLSEHAELTGIILSLIPQEEGTER